MGNGDVQIAAAVEPGTMELSELVRGLLVRLGEDPGRAGLADTPRRVADSLQFLTRGYGQTVEEAIGGAIFDEDHHNMVVVKDIELYSMCEHHMLPFFGRSTWRISPTAGSSV